MTLNSFHKTNNSSDSSLSNDTANQLLKSNHLFLAFSMVLYIFSLVYMFSLLDSDSERIYQKQVWETGNIIIPEIICFKFKGVNLKDVEETLP
jgi:hypothetical protein